MLGELALLDATLARLDLLADDPGIARAADLQGVGAPLRRPRVEMSP